MSSEPQESPKNSEKKSDRLPFEPARKKDAKPAKAPAISTPAKAEKKADKKAETKTTPKLEKKSARPAARREGSQIPEVVSRRMVGRMAFFSGIPTMLGMMTFVGSYFVVTQGLLKIPNSLVLLVSLGFFGLGVVGLSYGLLSASWDEDRSGSWLGADEFGINFGRLTGAWKDAREKNQKQQPKNSD